jgi:hypothetical protein
MFMFVETIIFVKNEWENPIKFSYRFYKQMFKLRKCDYS